MVARQAMDSEVRPQAPELTLRDERGKTVSLASLRGRPVLLSFLSHAA